MANTLDAALCLASARLLDHIRKGEHAVAVTIGQKSTNTLNNLVNDALEREREPSTARAILFSESQNKPSCELYDVVPIRAISNQNAPGIKKGILCEVSRATEETISITHDGETRRFGYPHKDFFQILQLKPLSVCAGDQLLVNRVGRKAEIPRRESLIRLRAVYPQHVETTDGVILAAGTSGFERGWCVDAAVHAPNQLFKNMLIVVPQKSNSVEIDLMWLNKWAKKCTGTLELFGVEGSFSHEKTILRTPQMGTPGDELGRSDEISPAHP